MHNPEWPEGKTPLLKDLKYVDRSLAVACTRGREAVVSRFRKMLQREDLSEQQWRVLRILHDFGRLNSVQIADQSCIHKTSISRIVKTLEQRDIVERSPHETDSRISYVALTVFGQTMMDRLIVESTTIHEKIADDFGHDNYLRLLELLKKLAKLNEPG
ncbi:MarR family transcriptional regulator [Pararhodobacter sp. CCB-MM2]|uniref:MarR family transcriptional regulator n=1 Tax=Pararhodobacter sp. CCB-MM2 TaxID=1786003 RepID=UPI0008352D17|nr:MarR family transcriptional regulator [Pararhodobacter sp. CCB-MM2]MCA2011563.1 MarR family transcriptional regulator [Cereibacter sphaeroides]